LIDAGIYECWKTVGSQSRRKTMVTIKSLLEQKGYYVWSVKPDDTVFEALELMADKNVGAVVVMDGGKLVGIMSERDYARKVTLKGKRPHDTKVDEIMTSEVIGLGVDHTIEHCMALMTKHHFRHLPIFEGEELIGIISIGDVVKAVIAEQEFMIDQLQSYIRSG
jgi:CBS domain-containing protein